MRSRVTALSLAGLISIITAPTVWAQRGFANAATEVLREPDFRTAIGTFVARLRALQNPADPVNLRGDPSIAEGVATPVLAFSWGKERPVRAKFFYDPPVTAPARLSWLEVTYGFGRPTNDDDAARLGSPVRREREEFVIARDKKPIGATILWYDGRDAAKLRVAWVIIEGWTIQLALPGNSSRWNAELGYVSTPRTRARAACEIYQKVGDESRRRGFDSGDKCERR